MEYSVGYGIQRAGWKQKLPKFGFCAHTTALWPVEHSVCQVGLPCGHPEYFTTACDCETALYLAYFLSHCTKMEYFLTWTLIIWSDDWAVLCESSRNWLSLFSISPCWGYGSNSTTGKWAAPCKLKHRKGGWILSRGHCMQGFTVVVFEFSRTSHYYYKMECILHRSIAWTDSVHYLFVF